ncbi:MAG TPA: ABC transporter permease subunit [Aquabacterium sp.]|nr:ABC transporter permease subunit [Aquabacterium sp.]HQC98124.1 ABC transporter permease subunit [Aquabacterium sp.]
MQGAWQVFLKELRDALRDRRTLLMVLLSSVALGPLLLVALSVLVADFEARAEARTLYTVGLDGAPTLANYIARQAWTVHPAPEGHEQALVARQFEHPVLVVPPEFERDLADGIAPELLLLSSSANQRAEGSAGSVAALLQGFNQEQAGLRLALRGVAPQALQVLKVQRRDLGGSRAGAAQFMRLLPFFVLMAVLYGALHAALDTTAGERERGSLEPLLMTPQPRWALVLGKWGAVAAMGMGVAVLACAGFLPGQWLLRSEALAAMFQYGLRELGLFLAVLLPAAAALAALLMAVAIRSRSFKEAQAGTTVVVLGASLLPMLTSFNGGGEQPWHLWLPVLAQVTLMQRVLEGGALGAVDLLLPVVVAALLTAACLADVARQLRGAAWR